VVLRLDDSVRRTALTGDVTIESYSQFSFPFRELSAVATVFLEALTGRRVLPCRFPC
jgi:hypothetical protein